jgi:hypothetical protein
MADTRFTALGMARSGKTCYILGLYRKMGVGVNGFRIFTNGSTASKLDEWLDTLNDRELGNDRFPAGTSNTANTKYEFLLKYQGQSILSLDWCDYAGNLLKTKDESSKTYQELLESIRCSTCLYIFIDGDLLTSEDPEDRLDDVADSARKIGHFLSDYSNKHGKFPPIVFVITKSDIVNIDSNELESILKTCYSDVFNGGTDFIAVTHVSLGKDITDDGFTGKVRPQNIHIPFFLGIYQEFLMAFKNIEYDLKKINNENANQIQNNKNIIRYENDRWFFHNQERIASSRKEIDRLDSEIKANESRISELRSYLIALRDELVSNQDKYTCFEDGKETDFSNVSFFKLS